MASQVVKIEKSISALGHSLLKSESRQVADPQKETGQSEGRVIEPPYDPEKIAELVQLSSILPQCISAMVIGCERKYMLEQREDGVKTSDEEWSKVDTFFSNVDPEGRDDFLGLRKKLRTDRETFGYACMELIRNITGEMIGLRHIPAATMKMTPIGSELVECTVKKVVKGKIIEEKCTRRFRKFMQEVAGEKVWFKEWGDPRTMDYTSGDFLKDSTKSETAATEVIWLGNYNPASVYGRPRWVGCEYEVAGVRAASECNYSYFDNNAIPSAVITVSGGTVADETIDSIRSFMTDVTQQRGGANSVLIIEAVPAGTDNTYGGVPDARPAQTKIEIKSLRDVQQNDAQFLEYNKDAKSTIRSAFRLPPLLIGLSDDYTLATAKESLKQAEENVFAPEREEFDKQMNRILVYELGVATWSFKTVGIDVNDPEEVSALITVADATGALKVNEIRDKIGTLLGMDLEKLPDEFGELPRLFSQYVDNSNDLNNLNKSQLFKALWKIREGLKK